MERITSGSAYKSIFDFSSFMWVVKNKHRILDNRQEKQEEELRGLIEEIRKIKRRSS